MNKESTIPDELYRRPKREAGGRSGSEVVAKRCERSHQLGDVTGTGVLDADTYEAPKEDVKTHSDGAGERFDDTPR